MAKACPRGKKLVRIPGRSFCASTSKKKSGSRRKKTGAAAMSTAARKAMVRKACKNPKIPAAKKAKMKGLCRWAAN